MHIKNYLILAVAICVIHQSFAFNFCKCKEKGLSECGCKKSITAPRPYPIQMPRMQKPIFRSICKEHSLPSGPKPFEPINDDACHCGQQIVKPAPLPRVRPNIEWPKLKSCNCNCRNEDKKESSEDCGKPIPYPGHHHHSHKPHHHRSNCGCSKENGATVYFENAKRSQEPEPERNYAPADVVSIAIAKRLSASAKNGISERNLQYGSLKQPTVEQKESSKHRNINEENFYSTNGRVLELKPYIFKQQVQESSEEDSSEEKKKKRVPNAFNPAQLDFADIGYKPYEGTKPRYVVVKNSEPVKHDCNKQKPKKHHHHHKKQQSCDCYKDLVVDQSGISEQSMSYESAQDHSNTRHFST